MRERSLFLSLLLVLRRVRFQLRVNKRAAACLPCAPAALPHKRHAPVGLLNGRQSEQAQDGRRATRRRAVVRRQTYNPVGLVDGSQSEQALGGMRASRRRAVVRRQEGVHALQEGLPRVDVVVAARAGELRDRRARQRSRQARRRRGRHLVVLAARQQRWRRRRAARALLRAPVAQLAAGLARAPRAAQSARPAAAPRRSGAERVRPFGRLHGVGLG